MSFVTSIVMSTVNASYIEKVTPELLAQKLIDTHILDIDCCVFAFLTEVSPKFQYAFIEEMNIPLNKVKIHAIKYSQLLGYELPLAKNNN